MAIRFTSYFITYISISSLRSWSFSAMTYSRTNCFLHLHSTSEHSGRLLRLLIILTFELYLAVEMKFNWLLLHIVQAFAFFSSSYYLMTRHDDVQSHARQLFIWLLTADQVNVGTNGVVSKESVGVGWEVNLSPPDVWKCVDVRQAINVRNNDLSVTTAFNEVILGDDKPFPPPAP